MSADDPLSPAELAFRKLLEPVKHPHTGHLQLSKEYQADCAAARLRWEKANVVWYYGQNGKGGSTWGRDRPKPELYRRLQETGQLRWMHRATFLAELATAQAKTQKGHTAGVSAMSMSTGAPLASSSVPASDHATDR